MAETLERSRQTLVAAVSVEAAATQHVIDVQQQLASHERELGERREQERAARAALVESRKRLRQWAVDVYTGGGLRQAQYVFEAEDLNDVPRRLGLAEGALGAADGSIREEKAALAELRTRVTGLEEAVEATRRQLAGALEAVSGAGARADAARREVLALTAGAEIVPHGIAFPVFGPTRFTDTFGAPRMVGTRFAHAHQGVDIFAMSGMPVRAFERGVLARVGTDLLGGIKLWLVGQSGTQYYYAHLQGYAPGMVSGRVVNAGEVVAFVGNTGNAIHTPPHLHFEIHPHGGAAVNPYPILTQMLTVTGATGPPTPAPPPAPPPAAPKKEVQP